MQLPTLHALHKADPHPTSLILNAALKTNKNGTNETVLTTMVHEGYTNKSK